MTDNYKYYPEYTDENFQKKIYEKREFYDNKILPYNKSLDNYNDIKNYRDKFCSGEIRPYTQQVFLSNFINPLTPYKGLLMFHGVGTGKTGGAIAVAENFKDMVLKYGNKIHIVVPGPLIKKGWRNDINKFTKKRYINNIINSTPEISEKIIDNELWGINSKYYKLITYKSFYKKILGEKIKEVIQEKIKVRKTNKIVEREISIDKIENLDNTLLIIDEAHSMTDNEWGLALEEIIKKSKNLRILLLTATPMKNLGTDIIKLLNFLRPLNDKIKQDKLFTKPKYNHELELKPDGIEYFKNMIMGYVSYYRGAHPLLFAKQIDMGVVPKELKFTKVIECYMEDFQLDKYLAVKEISKDTLETGVSAVSNIVLPGLNDNNNDIVAYYGINGINKLNNQLEKNKNVLLNKLNNLYFDGKEKNIDTILYYDTQINNIGGKIFKLPYIKNFSIKFYTIINNINKLYNDNIGTCFIYSNLVKNGVELFEQVLLQNGYLEYNSDEQYDFTDDTKDYLYGLPYSEYIKKYNQKTFYPSTYLKITSSGSDPIEINEEKHETIFKVFNNINNIKGKNIKCILGSRVMAEGTTLENIKEIHIIDVNWNLGRTYQIIGRGLRICKHYNVMTEKNPYPEVRVYKYVSTLKKAESSDIKLYRKAEYKYVLIKDIERILKETSIDCPINYSMNVFPEEVKKYKDCERPNFDKKQDPASLCPDVCDFMKCYYKCYDKKLNLEYYDKNSNIYKLIKKENIDYSTYTSEFTKKEIDNVKDIIKKLFVVKYVYTLEEILINVRNTIIKNINLFDNYFVYQALNAFILIDENDFNNFNDIIYDKYNRSGYLIYINKFYIFQEFTLNKFTPLYYRNIYDLKIVNNIGLNNYINKTLNYKHINIINKKEKDKELIYDFDMKYYDKKKENKYVGIIDIIINKKRYSDDIYTDIFKIREKINKNLTLKRGVGVFSIKGAVCGTSQDKDELFDIAHKIGIKKSFLGKKSKTDLCNLIKFKLLYLEKYNTENITYMMLPSNHKFYPFPYNLNDRINFINDKLKLLLDTTIKFNIEKQDNGIFDNKRDKKYIKYLVSFNNKNYNKNAILNVGFKFDNNKFSLIIE